MAGHGLICNARQGSESRDYLVAPEPKPFSYSRSIVPRAKYGLSATVHFPIGGYQSNRRLKALDGNVLVEPVYLQLERSDINLVTEFLLPSANPTQTKVAFAIVEEERFLGRRFTMNQAIWTLNHSLTLRIHLCHVSTN
jgi:hypothetical protein